LTSFETRDIFKSTALNGDSFVDEVEAKCDTNSIVQQEAPAGSVGAAYSNGDLHSDYVFTKPTLDLENMGMAYGVSGLYLQGNGVGSPSAPSQTGLMSPSMMASEKLNGLTLEQMTPPYGFDVKTTASLGFPPGLVTYPPARAISSGTTKQFMSAPQTLPVAQVVTSQAPPATNGIMSRFGSQEILMAAVAAESNSMESVSPVLSPSSSEGKEQEKHFYGLQQQGLLRQESGVDTDDFVDQVFVEFWKLECVDRSFVRFWILYFFMVFEYFYVEY